MVRRIGPALRIDIFFMIFPPLTSSELHLLILPAHFACQYGENPYLRPYRRGVGSVVLRWP